MGSNPTPPATFFKSNSKNPWVELLEAVECRKCGKAIVETIDMLEIAKDCVTLRIKSKFLPQVIKTEVVEVEAVCVP